MSDEKLPRNLVRRKPGGVLYARFMIDGRDVWRSTGYTTVKSALKKAQEMMVRYRQEGDFERKRDAPTFGSWVEDYLETFTPRKRAPWRDRQILAPALRTWRFKRLTDITPSLVTRYANERLRTVAPSTWNRERGTLQAVFERAVEDGLLERNPFRGLPREREGPRIRVLSVEDEVRLRAVLSPRFQRWLTFMLGTGLRLAEARAISINEVDFKNELIHVPEGAAKFGKARSVPLRPEVAEVVRVQQREVGMLWPSNEQNYRKVLAQGCVKAGIAHISPHDLRHTFATRYLQGGGDIYILSKILGHSSVKMTEEYYVHEEPRDLVERSRGVDLQLAARL